MAKNYLEGSYIYNVEDTDFSGKIIELPRNVDLARYNDYETVAKAIDWQVRCDSENEEFDIVAYRILKTYADRFILSATADGIKRYEQILGLDATGTLEERRRQIFFHWNKNIVYTERTLRKMLDVLVGQGNYGIELLYNDYTLLLDVIITGDFDADDIFSKLREIIPANLDIEIRIRLLNSINLNDSTKTYTNRFYMVGNMHKCGTIFRHQYVGKAITNNIKLPNQSNVRGQRQFNVGEIKSGGVKR